MCIRDRHNVVFRSEYAAVISFDNICYDVQIGDLARFMRKILEKNNWNMGLGMEMIRAYSDKKAMSPYETKQMCIRDSIYSRTGRKPMMMYF